MFSLLRGLLGGPASPSAALARLDPALYRRVERVPLRRERATPPDAIVVSAFGLFLVRSTPVHGHLEGHAESAFWTHRTRARQRKIRNPLVEASGDVRVLADTLDLPTEHIHPIVAFSDRCTYGADIPPGVPSTDLCTYVESFRHVVFGADDVIWMTACLVDLKRTRRTVLPLQMPTLVERHGWKNLCPECGADLVPAPANSPELPEASRCANFPACPFTTRHPR